MNTEMPPTSVAPAERRDGAAGRGGAAAFSTRALIGVAVLCLIVQTLAATRLNGFDSPNFASTIARSLAFHGRYECDAWYRLRGSYGPKPAEAIRAFHLPGEPLYLAAGFKVLPETAWRFLHVPVVVVLVTATTAAVMAAAGVRLGVIAGLLLTFQPFLVVHGPVWDDTILGAALDWVVYAILIVVVAWPATTSGWSRWAVVALTFLVAGFAGITRTQSQATLGLLCIVVLLAPAFRAARWPAVAAILGLAVGLAAWGMRNKAVTGSLLLGSTHDGITLWESNYPSAREALLQRGQVERMDDERMADDYARTATMSEFDANRYFTTRGTRYVAAHPGEVLATGLIKLGVTVAGVDPVQRLWSVRNLVALVSNGALVVLAAVGIRRLWRIRSRGMRLFKVAAAVTAAAFVGLTLIGPVGLRYRVSVDPIFTAAAAAALVGFFQPRQSNHAAEAA